MRERPVRSGRWITRRGLRIAAVVFAVLLAAAVVVALIAQHNGHLTQDLANAIGLLFLLIGVAAGVVGLLLRIWAGPNESGGDGSD